MSKIILEHLKSSPYLHQDPLFHLPILHPLKFEETKVMAEEEQGILIEVPKAGVYVMSAVTPEIAKKLLLPPFHIEENHAFLCMQEFMVPLVQEMYPFQDQLICYQYYAPKEMETDSTQDFSSFSVLIDHKQETLELRRPTPEELENISEHFCAWSSKEYYNERAKSGRLFGAFLHDKLVGVIGFHIEGGSGLLFVKEAYRHLNIANHLVHFAIGETLKRGEIPYGHVETKNQASQHLQEKIGLKKTKGIVTWLL